MPHLNRLDDATLDGADAVARRRRLTDDEGQGRSALVGDNSTEAGSAARTR